MSIYSYHLAETSWVSSLQTLISPPQANKIRGLQFVECMNGMTLGSPVFSTDRILPGRLAVFAQWENEASLDYFLSANPTGRKLSHGWHLRLQFLRQWGHVTGLTTEHDTVANHDAPPPVAAVTIARMKLSQVPRFIQWGRPTEKLVRNHPGSIFSFASIRLPRTVSTFSVWNTEKDMTDMVRGHSAVSQPKRHLNAMKERERKDFHFEFTTLRFKILSEHGTWQGKNSIVLQSNTT